MRNINSNFVYVSEEEKKLLLNIAGHELDGDYDNFQVSLPQLMLRLGKSRYFIKEILRVPCLRKGILEIVFVGTGNRASIYKLNVDVEHLKKTPAGLCFVIKKPQPKKEADIQRLKQTPAGLSFATFVDVEPKKVDAEPQKPTGFISRVFEYVCQPKKKRPTLDALKSFDESSFEGLDPMEGGACGFWQRLMSSNQGDKR
ncbi:hypothetical protein UFOVP1597_27 [uncultured Caudovirales phage]|uniref:Uncharacterized protein n=1 Tax=uncultured Caudovirales phage TaxID=2100421 RepID=A0A6J5SUY6_9CAUD|nr:hypothetical protein UFOVP1597_27 [uncultured Caudovirales phage]